MASARAVHSDLAQPGHDCYHLGVFGIGYLELLVLGLLVILLFPPRELPKLARQAARAYGSVRRIADDFHRTVMLDEELRSPIDEIRGAYDEARWDIRRAGDRIKNELSSAGEEVKKAVNPGALPEVPEPLTPEEQAYLDGAQTLVDADTEPQVPRDPMSKFPAQVGDLEPSPLVGEESPGALVSGQVDSGKGSAPDELQDYESPYGAPNTAPLPRRTLPAVPAAPDGRVAASASGVPGAASSNLAGVPTMQEDEPTQVHPAARPPSQSPAPSAPGNAARAGLPGPRSGPPKAPPAPKSPRGGTAPGHRAPNPVAPPAASVSQARGSTSPGLAIPSHLARPSTTSTKEEIDESALTRVTRLPKPPSLGVDAGQEPGQDPPPSQSE